MEKAGEAIDFLSSLPGTSGGSTPGTSTDSGNLSQLFNRVFSPHPHTKFYSAINFYNFLKVSAPRLRLNMLQYVPKYFFKDGRFCIKPYWWCTTTVQHS